MVNFEEEAITLEKERIRLIMPEKEYLEYRLKQVNEQIDAAKARINGYYAIIQRRKNDV